MADFDRAFSRLAECPAAQINRFSTVHPRERIQDQAVPDLIEFQSWFVIGPKLLRFRRPIRVRGGTQERGSHKAAWRLQIGLAYRVRSSRSRRSRPVISIFPSSVN